MPFSGALRLGMHFCTLGSIPCSEPGTLSAPPPCPVATAIINVWPTGAGLQQCGPVCRVWPSPSGSSPCWGADPVVAFVLSALGRDRPASTELSQEWARACRPWGRPPCETAFYRHSFFRGWTWVCGRKGFKVLTYFVAAPSLLVGL